MRYVLAQVTTQPVAEPDPWDPDIAALLRMFSFSRYTSLVLGRIAVLRTYVDAAHCYADGVASAWSVGLSRS